MTSSKQSTIDAATRDVEGQIGTPTQQINSGRASRIGTWTLLLGFGALVAWSSLAPLDEGVPCNGAVMLDTKRKIVQHFSGGIVKTIGVREGDMVKEGQVLFTLDEAIARANFESVRQRYLGLRAVQGRLVAELSGKPAINLHADLRRAQDDPFIRAQIQNQSQLFASRRAALGAEIQGIEESIQGQLALQNSYRGMLVSRKSQLDLINEELRNTRELVKEGYVPRNRQLELERAIADATAGVTELQGNIERTARSVAELRQRTISRQQDYRKELETQLSDTAREVQSDAEKLVAVTAELERSEIRSPATGQVVGLAVQTAGSVIQAGQKLLDVVPLGDDLLLEVRVEPQLIDRVHAGLPADVRFSGFSHSPQLVVSGEVQSVSGDLLTDAQSNISYYLARVKVLPKGMKELGNRKMQPGMPAEVIVKTGERSLLTYLLNPLTKRLASAMKEE